MSKVSIIIPVYGVEKYIERCLNSVVNQTLKDIEIIIVNDDTKDNSMAICEKYARQDNRIKIYNKENEGLGLTRNYGIERASSKYIAFLDSDDYVDIDYYEKLYRQIVKEGADVCFSSKKRVDNYGKIMLDNDIFLKPGVYSSKQILDFMLIKTPENRYKKISMSAWRALYNIDVLEKFNIKFVSEREYISEDFLFTIDYLFHAKKVTFVNDTYHYYCYNGASLTNSYKADRFEKALTFIEKLRSKFEEYGLLTRYEKSIYVFLLGYVRVSIKQEIFASKHSDKTIKKRISQIISNDTVIRALHFKYKTNLKNKILDIALRSKNTTLIIFIFKLNNIIKGD